MYFRDNSYSDGIDRFMVITVATEENEALDRFKHSCHVNNIPYKILGIGQEWTGGPAENGVLLQPGGAQKINLLKEELKSYPDLGNHIIMFTDSYDVLFNDGPKNIVKKFREMESTVVFSAEKTCWPDESLEEKYPITMSEYRFLNSGGFIGYGDHINEIINKVEVGNDYDDQLYYTERFFDSLEGDKNIILDHQQDLFQTLGNAVESVKVVDGKVYNHETNSYPMVIHGNGGSYVKETLNQMYVELFGEQQVDSQITFKKSNYDFDKDVTIVLFLDEKVNDINQAFDHVRFLSYPKEKTSLIISYRDDEHTYKVEKFREKYSKLFKDFSIDRHELDKINSRKQILVDLFDKGDAVVLMETNHIFRNNKSLQILLNECEGIISPMIHHEGTEWVNFDLVDAETKKDYRTYKQTGIWDVNVTFGIHIILNDVIPFVVNALNNNYNSYDEGNWDVLMCENLRSKGYRIQLSNTNYYGGII